MRISLIVFTFLFISHVLQGQTRIDSLKTQLELAEVASDSIPLLNEIANSLLDINPNEGIIYADQAVILTRKEDIKENLAIALKYKGGNLMYAGRYEEALTAFQESLQLYREVSDEQSIADITGNIGMVYNQLGLFSDALKYQFLALEAYETLAFSPGICNTNYAIGSIYYSIEKHEEALIYCSVGLKCFESDQDAYGIAMANGTLANILSMNGEVDSAESHHIEAIEGFLILENYYDLAREYGNYSSWQEQKGNLVEALKLSASALEIYKEFEYLPGVAHAAGNMGSFYLTAVQKIISKDSAAIIPGLSEVVMLDRAQDNLKQALQIAENQGDLRYIEWLTKNLADVYELQHDYQNSLRLYREAQKASDSLYTLESSKEIEALITEREILLRDKQIELDRLEVLKIRNEKIYFILGLVLLGVLLTTLYFNYRRQLKSNDQLKSLNGEVTSMNNQLENKNFSLNNALTELQQTQEQLILTERQKEQAELRSRISQDIHDDISSGLTKISWLAESFKSKLKKAEPESLIPLVNKINNSSQETVSKLSEIIWSTNPEKDNVHSFLLYLRNHIQTFFEDTPMSYQIDFPKEKDDTPLNPNIRRNLYLVVKEALNNAFKYSEANLVQVKFERFLDNYRLTVKDNGRGLYSENPQGSGNGFHNMESRMKAIGGEVNIESSPDKGVHLEFTGNIEIN